MTLDDASAKVARLYLPDAPKIDPVIIAVILELIAELLPVLIDQCSVEPEEVPEKLNCILTPHNMVDRVRRLLALRQVKRVLGSQLFAELNGGHILDSMCVAGLQAEPGDIEGLIDDIGYLTKDSSLLG